MLRRLSWVLLFVALLAGISAAGTHADTLLRINCGGPRLGYQLPDGSTVYFSADEFFTGNSGTLSTTHTITTSSANAPFAQVYQTCNTSTTTLTYTLPGYRPTKPYIVRLHFAEISLNVNAVGQRVMNVTINGKSAVANFDIFQAAGGQYIAYDKDVNVVSDSSGRIVVQLAAVTGSSCVNGIEVLSIPRFQTDVPLPAWAQGALASDGGGVTGAGPSAADSVNAGSGVYENNPGADIGANNPVGPSPVFARSYRTTHAFNGGNSPGLPVGWTHNYDLRLVDDGATIVLPPLSSANPQTPIVLPTAQQMRLLYPNGAQERWTYFPPTGITAVPLQTPNGTPYSVTGLPRLQQVPGTPTWIWLKVTFKDRSQWLFTPYTKLPNYYRLTRITNVMGRFITLNYDTANRLLSITNDAATPATLLAFNYGTQGYLQSVVEYTDFNNPRSVLYTCANGISSGAPGDVVANDICLLEVSQIAAQSAARPARWKYAYQDLLDGPFLLAVSAPSPTTPNTYVTHTIAYDSNDFVKTLMDADNNTRAYTYLLNGSGANIQVKGAADITPIEAWTQAANGFNLDAGSTDANNKQDMVTYGDPANPYLPTQTLNKNGQSAQMTYDRSGNATSTAAIVNGNLLTTTYTYDYTQFALGQLTSIQTGSKTATFLHYNAAGLVSQIDTPKPNTSGTGDRVSTFYTYTALGNVQTVTMPAPNDSGVPVTITYNYTADPLDGITNYPEALGRPLTVTDAMGHITHYRYDSRGNVVAVITVVNGIRRQTTIAYNVADQPVQVIYPATGQTGLGNSSVFTSYQYPGGPVIATTLYDEFEQDGAANPHYPGRRRANEGTVGQRGKRLLCPRRPFASEPTQRWQRQRLSARLRQCGQPPEVHLSRQQRRQQPNSHLRPGGQSKDVHRCAQPHGHLCPCSR